LGKYQRLFALIRIVLLVAFVLAIVSGVWTSPGSSHINTGYELRRAADILFLIVVLLMATVALLLLKSATSREQRKDLHLIQVFFVVPFLLIRIVYATVQAFLSTPTNPGHNVWVYLGLLTCPDAISVLIYAVCGYLIPKEAPIARDAETELRYAKLEAAPGQQPQPDADQMASTAYVNPPVQQQPPRRFGGRRGGRRLRGPIGMLIALARGDD
jgi:hypothetical protein